MTNQLEEELKAIENTILAKQITINRHKHDIEILRQEKEQILQKLGITGDLL